MKHWRSISIDVFSCAYALSLHLDGKRRTYALLLVATLAMPRGVCHIRGKADRDSG